MVLGGASTSMEEQNFADFDSNKADVGSSSRRLVDHFLLSFGCGMVN